jgi:light-regulated signal transduction histidine kinase (bacteriophytochrome)
MSNTNQSLTDFEIERLRKALEAESERCRELQTQLDRASAGFEDFVITAAHDLREPLRDVAAFSQLLAEGDRAIGECLDRIRAGAARMESLLADVVDYWSLGTSGAPDCQANMEAVCDQAVVLAGVQADLVTRDPLPSVRGDFHILTQVLRRLIRNAIEYCGRPDPLVHISAQRRNLDQWVISVRDNGPGIDAAFHERVFGAFKRLHGKEFPGHGLGLAFCRKAIESQGGRIWMESTPGTGSTFYFSVPVLVPRPRSSDQIRET